MSFSKSTGRRLPKEAIQFAKKMGISLDGLEPEAEEIWKMLDELSNSDPAQYQSFIAEQLQEGGVADEDSSRRSFRPEVGFVVKAQTKGGGDSIIKEVNNSDPDGKPLYVNVCSSRVVEEPVDSSGNPVKGNFLSTPDVSIPLAVGEKRNIADNKSLAVDVVVNKSVLDAAMAQAMFQKQLVDLCLHWVQQETKLECTGAWTRYQEASYIGGRGENGDIPVLFFVSSECASENAHAVPASSSKAHPIESASDLLKAVNQQKECENSALEEQLVIDKNHGKVQSNVKDACSKKLIEEITPVDSKTSHHTGNKKEQQEVSFAENNTGCFESSVDASTKDNGAAKPSKVEYQQMENLMQHVDDDFRKSDENDLLTKESAETMMADLARMLAGNSATLNTTPQRSNFPLPPPDTKIMKPEDYPITDQIQLINQSAGLLQLNLHIEQQRRSGSTLTLEVSRLKSTISVAALDLQVSEQEVVLRVHRNDIDNAAIVPAAPAHIIRVGANNSSEGFRFDPKAVSAAFKKKKGVLLIKLTYIESRSTQ